MANLRTMVTGAVIIGAGMAGWHYSQGLQDLYHSPLAEPIRNTPFPLIGLSTGITVAYATMKEAIRNRRGLRHIVEGLGLSLLPNVATSAWRWADKSHQYLAERLNGQAPHMQFLEDMAGAGVTLGLLYGATAIVMNGCEAVAAGYKKYFGPRTPAAEAQRAE